MKILIQVSVGVLALVLSVNAQLVTPGGGVPSGGTPGGSAGGVLACTYPNPCFATSPVFTGIPTAPTASPGTNTTQISTTAFVQAATALTSAVVGTPSANTLRDLPSVLDAAYGAKNDRIDFTSGCTVGTGTATINCTSASFVSGDVGKTFYILSAGAGNYVTTIMTVTDGTHIVGSSNAPGNYSNHSGSYGTDDTTAFQTAATSGLSFNIPGFCSSANIYPYCPTGGGYIINGSIHWGTQRIYGWGPQTDIVCLSTSAVCMQWDYPTALQASWTAGAQDITMHGSSATVGSSIGIELGGTNGAIGSTFERVTLGGFFTDATVANDTYDIHWNNSYFIGATHLLDITPVIGSGGESLYFSGDSFTHGGPDQGVTDISNCITVRTGTYVLVFKGGVMAVCQIAVSSAAVVSLDDVHMENPSANTSGQPYLAITGGFISAKVDVVNGIGTAGASSWATVSAGTLSISPGSTLISNVSTAVVAAMSGSGGLIFPILPKFPTSGWANVWSGSTTGFVNVAPQLVTAPQITTGTTTLNQWNNLGYCNGASGTFNLPVTPFPNQSITIKNISSGNTCNVNTVPVTISGSGGGSGAVVYANLTTGGVASYTIAAGGTSYSGTITCSVGGMGSGATCTATQSGGVINAVTETATGSGYNGILYEGTVVAFVTLYQGAYLQLNWSDQANEWIIPFDRNVSGALYVVGANGTGQLTPNTIFFSTGSAGGFVGAQQGLYFESGGGTVRGGFMNGGLPEINESTIASASTIAPTLGVVFVTGTTVINTLTAPSGCTTVGYDCYVYLISDPSTGPFTLGTSGNIYAAYTAVIGQGVGLFYHQANAKWYQIH